MRLQCKRIAVALAYALVVASVAGLFSTSAQAQRTLVSVTGSNIVPKIEGETSLPVQVITRDDIERANIQTAADLVNTLSANMSALGYSETQALGPGSAQPGFAGASLRGLGYARTLILLNGRRVANYAFNNTLGVGAAGVDLNFIPVSAIDRVEVLKDGASAIYGTDAIAGVINFILRKDYRGAEAYAQYTSPEHTGGYREHYNVVAGYGDLAAQKFNAFAMVDYQNNGGIRAKDRPFSASGYIPGLVDRTNNNSLPANVDTPVGTRNPTGDPNNTYHNPTCLPPLSFPTELSPNRCQFDPMSAFDIVDPNNRLNVIGALTWQFNPENQFFIQAMYVENKFTFTASQTPISNLTTFQGINHFYLPPTSAFYPHQFAQFFGIDGHLLNLFYRSVELGLRTDAPISKQWNVVAGLQGVIKGWDYNAAYSYNESNLEDRYFNGWLKESVIIPILNSGVVNPFGFNTPDVVALMSTAKINQTVRTAKGTVSDINVVASNNIYEMPAGPLALAAGLEARQEKLTQVSDALLASGDILAGGGNIPSVMGSRNVWALYAEANIPIVKTLEGNVAVRYDHYSDFGSTTNPKVSIRWQPSKALLMRTSVGTGFRAPTLPALHLPPLASFTPGNLSDPIRCPVTQLAQDCNTQFPANKGGNPLLQPELSTQWSVGGVWAPAPGLSLGLDYFDILVKKLHGVWDSVTIFDQCLDGINGSTCRFIHRGPVDPNFPNLPGPIIGVDQIVSNLGRLKVTGIDFNAQYQFPNLAWAQFKLTFNGTYNIKYLQQQADGSYINFVNHEMAGVIPYWRHYATLDWNYGPWQATLTQNYQMGTYDQCPDPHDQTCPRPNTGNKPRTVGDYSIFDLSGAYTGFKNVTVSAGIKNLMDRAPPSTNQTGSALPVPYDASYTDPHGRLYWAGIKYSYK